MVWSTPWFSSIGGLGIVGWVLAFIYRGRAMRYRAAFDRAFAIARRAYNFSVDERSELTRIMGEPIERHLKDTER